MSAKRSLDTGNDRQIVFERVGRRDQGKETWVVEVGDERRTDVEKRIDLQRQSSREIVAAQIEDLSASEPIDEIGRQCAEAEGAYADHTEPVVEILREDRRVPVEQRRRIADVCEPR